MTAILYAFGDGASEDRGTLKSITELYRVFPGSQRPEVALLDPELPAWGSPHPTRPGLVVVGRSASRDPTGGAINVRVAYSDDPQTWRAAQPFNPLNDPGVTSWGVTYQRLEVEMPWARTAIIDSPPGTPPTQYLAWQPQTESIGITYTVFRLRTAIQGPSLVDIFQTGAIADTLHFVPVGGQAAWMYYSPSSIQQATQPADGSPPLWTIDHEYWFDAGQRYEQLQLNDWEERTAQNAVIVNPGDGPIALAKPYLTSSLPGADPTTRYARPPFERVNMVPSQAGIVPIADALTPPRFYGQLEKRLRADGYGLVLGVT